jgi:membrane fusion protein (multidrug efflux system)
MNKKLVVRMIVMLVIVGVVLGAIVGFNIFKGQAIKKFMAGRGEPPQTVSTMKVAFEEWQPSLSAVGTLRAVRGVEVAPEVAGLVSEIMIKPGAEVKAGDILLKMRADDIAAQLQSLEASARLAELNFRRSAEQLAAKAISQAQHDIDDANLKAARAAVAQQQAQLAKKTLRAPFDGRLGITRVNPGQVLNPGEVVVTLQQLDPIYINFTVPQRSLGQVKTGQVVNVSVDAFPGKTFKGTISTINPKIDVATRNVQVEAVLRNTGGALRPGMFGNVSVDTGAKQRYLTLPQTAVTYNPYGETLFVVKTGQAGQASDAKDGKPTLTAQQVFVTSGPTRGDQIAIIKGLEEGTEVVTSGQLKLKNGTPLVINNKVLPANDPNAAPQEK